MEKQVEVQYLRPDQVIKAREERSLIFLPVGPIEWHGPHLPLGVDPLRAHFAAVAVAVNHLAVIERLAIELSRSRGVKVVPAMPMAEFPSGGSGHATLEETETVAALLPETVDISLLPARPEPLRNLDWAIVDDAGFVGGSSTPGLVGEPEDPRSTEEVRGREVWDRTVRNLARFVEEALHDE